MKGKGQAKTRTGAVTFLEVDRVEDARAAEPLEGGADDRPLLESMIMADR